ncbi:hypothetical protein MY11210_006987 [Beauveria gryllotalpidicola]
MKYTTLAAVATTATTGLVTAAGAYRHGGSETAWTPATQTQPPVAGFTLRPTPALRMPRAGLLIREDDDDDDDDDDDENGPGRITHGSVTATSTPAGSSSGSVTSAPRPSNTCGWDKNGAEQVTAMNKVYTNGAVGCCSGNNCSKIPKQCVERSKECDSDDNGGTLCCRHSSAPACYTWLISTSTAGRQETYSMLGCTDKPGIGTLLPTDPASAGSNSSSGGGGGGGGGKSNTGAIVGGVIGGIIALLLIVLFIWYVLRQRRRSRAEHAVADGRLRDSALSHASWAGEHDSRGSGVEKAYEAVPGRETQDRRSIGGYAATSTSPATTTTTTTTAADRGSPNEHLAYSVSSASGTMESQGGAGVVSSLSTALPPLAGVVEAPDTGVPQDSAAPVEVAGTTVTRETMQSRAELP